MTEKESWEVPCMLVIPRKDECEVFGLAFQGRTKMVLKRLVADSASVAAGGEAFIGRRLTHANGKVNAKCDDISRYDGKRLELRFAYPVGYPLKVQRRNGAWMTCAVRALDDRRYVVTGRDKDGVFDKIVPFDAADSMLAVGSPSTMYTVDQRVQVKTTVGFSYGLVNKVEVDHYQVIGETENWEKDVKHEDAVSIMRPSAPKPHVEFTDALNGKTIRFTAGTKNSLVCFINGVQQRKPVERVKYQPRLEGDQILIAGYSSAPITLPLGDHLVVSDLRILCNENKIKHNIVEEDLLMKTLYPYDETPDLIEEFEVLELTDRARLEDLEKKATKYLETIARRLRRNYHGSAASTGLRIKKLFPLIVAGVPENTPAHRAGFKKGDLITKVITGNGSWTVFGRDQLMTALGPRGAVYGGSEVLIEVSRSEETASDWGAALSGVDMMPTVISANDPSQPEVNLPEPKDTTLLKLTCETSLSFRNKLLTQLLPLTVYAEEMEPEQIADLVSSVKTCNGFTSDCIKAAHPGYSKGIDRDDLESIHYDMMEKLGIDPVPSAKIEAQFSYVTAFLNVYRIDMPTAQALLRDLLIENVLAMEEAFQRPPAE